MVCPVGIPHRNEFVARPEPHGAACDGRQGHRIFLFVAPAFMCMTCVAAVDLKQCTVQYVFDVEKFVQCFLERYPALRDLNLIDYDLRLVRVHMPPVFPRLA